MSENRHSRFSPSAKHRRWAVDARLLTQSPYCMIAVENYGAAIVVCMLVVILALTKLLQATEKKWVFYN